MRMFHRQVRSNLAVFAQQVPHVMRLQGCLSDNFRCSLFGPLEFPELSLRRWWFQQRFRLRSWALAATVARSSLFLILGFESNLRNLFSILLAFFATSFDLKAGSSVGPSLACALSTSSAQSRRLETLLMILAVSSAVICGFFFSQSDTCAMTASSDARNEAIAAGRACCSETRSRMASVRSDSRTRRSMIVEIGVVNSTS